MFTKRRLGRIGVMLTLLAVFTLVSMAPAMAAGTSTCPGGISYFNLGQYALGTSQPGQNCSQAQMNLLGQNKSASCPTASCSPANCSTADCKAGNCTAGNCDTANCSTANCNTANCGTAAGCQALGVSSPQAALTNGGYAANPGCGLQGQNIFSWILRTANCR